MTTIAVDIPTNGVPAGPGIAEQRAKLDDAGFSEVYVYDGHGQTWVGFQVEEVELWPCLERLRELGVDEVVLAPWEEERYPAEHRVNGIFDPAAVAAFVAASCLTLQAECRLRLRRPRQLRLAADATRAIRAIAALDFGPALGFLAEALEPDPIEEAVVRLESVVADLDLSFDPMDFDTQSALGVFTPHLFGGSALAAASLEHQQGAELVGAFLQGQLDDDQVASSLAELAEAPETRAAVCHAFELIDTLTDRVESDLEPKTGAALTQLRAGLDWQDLAGPGGEELLASVLSTDRIAAIEILSILRQTPRGLFFVLARHPTAGAPSFAAAMQAAERRSGAGGKLVSWNDMYSVFDTYVALYLEALEHIGILDRAMAEEIEGRYNGSWRPPRDLS